MISVLCLQNNVVSVRQIGDQGNDKDEEESSVCFLPFAQPRPVLSSALSLAVVVGVWPMFLAWKMCMELTNTILLVCLNTALLRLHMGTDRCQSNAKLHAIRVFFLQHQKRALNCVV